MRRDAAGAEIVQFERQFGVGRVGCFHQGVADDPADAMADRRHRDRIPYPQQGGFNIAGQPEEVRIGIDDRHHRQMDRCDRAFGLRPDF